MSEPRRWCGFSVHEAAITVITALLACYAARQWASTEKAIDVSRDTQEAIARPWLLLDLASEKTVVRDGALHVDLRNFGVGPAFDVTEHRCHFPGHDCPLNLHNDNRCNPDFAPVAGRPTIPPARSHQFSEDLSDIASGGKAHVVFQVKYRDQFSVQPGETGVRTTQFCLLVTNTDGAPIRLGETLNRAD